MFERPIHPKALSPAQERRLVDHLDERFLELTRGFKKRSADHFADDTHLTGCYIQLRTQLDLFYTEQLS